MNTQMILQGDCRKVLATLAEASIDSIVTDPPYELGFMGKKWDSSGIAYDLTVWRECLRVLKPGGHLLAFGGSRTYHRMVCAIEDAGFEIRDCIMWVYSSGFPKSHNISKAIDRIAGAEREVIGHSDSGRRKQSTWNPDGTASGVFRVNDDGFDVTAPATEDAKKWAGWGSALKPSHEPIVVARKSLEGTLVENVLEYGTGGINIDDCRVGYESTLMKSGKTAMWHAKADMQPMIAGSTSGRWPANFIHDGSDDVVALFPDRDGGAFPASQNTTSCMMTSKGKGLSPARDMGDTGSAARFFYCAKASQKERGEENIHPTVKPIALMRYLCRLVTPPGGTVLDPFAGSGTTLLAARMESFSAVGVELSAEHCKIIKERLDMETEPEENEDLPKSTKKQLSLW